MRPIRSPTLLPIRMNAADTSASSAIADWTPLTVVSRSCTTAAIDTFINEVSTTSTNIAIASRIANRRFSGASTGTSLPLFSVITDSSRLLGLTLRPLGVASECSQTAPRPQQRQPLMGDGPGFSGR